MKQKSCKILLVEDSESIRSMLKLALQVEGYEIYEAVDGLDALSKLNTRLLPDLILLDMLMPKMNGWEFVDVVKKDSNNPISKIPILAVTATTEKVQRTPGEIQAVIKKPIELNVLYDLVRRFCSPSGQNA